MYERLGVVVQCRMSSTRLPGKAMLQLYGMPTIGHTLSRCLVSGYNVCLATTESPVDDVLEQYAEQVGVSCYRGSEENVLARTIEAAQAMKWTSIIKVTGDCVLIHPQIIKVMAYEYMLRPAYAYVSNCHPERYAPPGLDVEVCSVAALEEVYSNNPTDYEREHPLSGIYGRFPERVYQVRCPANLPPPGMVFCIDTMEDYQQVTAQMKPKHKKVSDGSN